MFGFVPSAMIVPAGFYEQLSFRVVVETGVAILLPKL
jgi:hypothetical protein